MHRLRLAVALLLSAVPTFVAPAETAPRSQWAIDPARTRISFFIEAVGYPRTEGKFHHFDGQISVDFDDPAQSRVRFEVESRSVDVGSTQFSDYLRSDALLDAARFKEITFSSTAVEKIDERHIRVTGDLTMLGVTRPLEVNVTVDHQAGQLRARLGFTAQATINRLEFGMNSGYPLISRDVDLVVASEAVER